MNYKIISLIIVLLLSCSDNDKEYNRQSCATYDMNNNINNYFENNNNIMQNNIYTYHRIRGMSINTDSHVYDIIDNITFSRKIYDTYNQLKSNMSYVSKEDGIYILDGYDYYNQNKNYLKAKGDPIYPKYYTSDTLIYWVDYTVAGNEDYRYFVINNFTKPYDTLIDDQKVSCITRYNTDSIVNLSNYNIFNIVEGARVVKCKTIYKLNEGMIYSHDIHQNGDTIYTIKAM